MALRSYRPQASDLRPQISRGVGGSLNRQMKEAVEKGPSPMAVWCASIIIIVTVSICQAPPIYRDDGNIILILIIPFFAKH